jgi:hypothetical protein
VIEESIKDFFWRGCEGDVACHADQASLHDKPACCLKNKKGAQW